MTSNVDCEGIWIFW